MLKTEIFRLVCCSALIFSSAAAWTQENPVTQDPQAGRVLDRVVLKTKSMQSMQADFTLIIEDRKEKTKHSSAGSLLLKQNMYKITQEKSIVYFNGITMWTYIPDQNEVTITEPVARAEDFMSNPAQFFTRYQSDFKYRYLRETTVNSIRCHEIDLFPKNLDQPYSRIKVFVNVTSDLPEIVSSIGKDGIDYTVYLKNIILDRVVDNSAFTFDPAKYRRVDIIDMRGI